MKRKLVHTAQVTPSGAFRFSLTSGNQKERIWCILSKYAIVADPNGLMQEEQELEREGEEMNKP